MKEGAFPGLYSTDVLMILCLLLKINGVVEPTEQFAGKHSRKKILLPRKRGEEYSTRYHPCSVLPLGKGTLALFNAELRTFRSRLSTAVRIFRFPQTPFQPGSVLSLRREDPSPGSNVKYGVTFWDLQYFSNPNLRAPKRGSAPQRLRCWWQPGCYGHHRDAADLPHPVRPA